MQSEWAQAGIQDPELVAAYSECRRLNAEHGKTYYLATLLLPAAKRPFVHSLYGFARYADEIVDAPADDGPPGRRRRLDALRHDLAAAMDSTSTSPVPVIAAVVDTTRRWDIDTDTFSAFLDSMAMDLDVDHYDTYDDLRRYMYGSAAVIGLQVLPILEPSDTAAARVGAIALGEAFQLANFIRDVDEDLDRGRIYLPLDELAAFGVTPQRLRRRVVDDDLRAALQYQVRRVRDLGGTAAATVPLLHPATRDCIDTARILYCGIADRVAEIDYQIFDRRARVPRRRRAQVAARAWRRAVRARGRYGPGRTSAIP
ncbi:MAG: phytoene/squalene synthase family protein [Candidatus Nanopelagicales bacterium]